MSSVADTLATITTHHAVVVANNGSCTIVDRPQTAAALKRHADSEVAPTLAPFTRGEFKGTHAVYFDEEGPYRSPCNVRATAFLKDHVDVPNGRVHGRVVLVMIT